MLVDRKSKFQAHATSIQSSSSVNELIQGLVSQDKSIQRASHQAMYAWRTGTPSTDSKKQPQVQQQGMNDCGEAGAGMRLVGLLERTGLVNVLVVVTRWYGGTPLGNARFRHISTVAVEALREGGFLEPPAKKGKRK